MLIIMDFPQTQLVAESITQFAEKMGQNHSKIEDGVLTVRVVGEFSAGKTRVIREILSDQIPEPLSPISSLEAQTKLQLEISYGEDSQLLLIEKPEDYDNAVILQQLSHFPSRQEVEQYDPETHRLRLLLNEPKFILPKGDGYSDDTQPKKLFLIDTPGWNSGDDDLAEQDAHQYFVGEHNLAIVYVCHANRLDGEINKVRLENFLEALGDAMFLTGKAHLHLIITHCSKESQQRLSQRMQERILQQWQNLYFEPEQLLLNITALDFAEMSEQDIQNFRHHFWQELLKPIGQEKFEFKKGYVEQILQWQNDWDIRPILFKQIAALRKVEQILNLSYIDGQFIQNMNMTRLKGLSKNEMQQRLIERWLKQVNLQNLTELNGLSRLQKLPDEHPLSEWWNRYWLIQLRVVEKKFKRFIDAMNQAVQSVDDNTQDLQAHLSAKVLPLYLAATDKTVMNAFDLLLQVVEEKMQNLSLDKFTATLLKISILQSRYQDYYNHQTIAQPVKNTSVNELDQGVWTDPKTGLMWAKISIGQKWENGKCIGDATKMNWEEAKKACQSFQLAGYNDWRLPTIGELKTLMLEKRAGYNCPNGVLYQPKQNKWGYYWSASPNASNDDYAWGVGFLIGNSNHGNKGYNSYVRVVRTIK